MAEAAAAGTAGTATTATTTTATARGCGRRARPCSLGRPTWTACRARRSTTPSRGRASRRQPLLQPPAAGGGRLSVGGGAGGPAEDDGGGAPSAPLLLPQPLARGVIAQGGRTPLGLAFPSVAVSPGGSALFAFAYSEGPGWWARAGAGGGGAGNGGSGRSGGGSGGSGGGGSGPAPSALFPTRTILLPDGAPPFAGAALATVSGPRAAAAYVPGPVVVQRRGAGPVASAPIPGAKGPAGEPVLRLGGRPSASSAAAIGGGGGVSAAPTARFATATAYAATPPAWAPGAAAPTNLGVWVGSADVAE